MVDVGAKDVTVRHASARARVRMSHDTFERLVSGDTPKGDVLAVAREFRSQRPQLLAVLDQVPLDQPARRRAAAYLEDFFSDIADDQRAAA